MSDQRPKDDPTVEEIVASLRGIITQDKSQPTSAAANAAKNTDYKGFFEKCRSSASANILVFSIVNLVVAAVDHIFFRPSIENKSISIAIVTAFYILSLVLFAYNFSVKIGPASAKRFVLFFVILSLAVLLLVGFYSPFSFLASILL